MREIKFNGVSNLSIPAYVISSKLFNSSAPRYETASVPGRNGDLIYAEGTFENVALTYRMAIREDVTDLLAKVDAMKAWLYPCADNYYKLTDSEDRAVYRMAQFVGPFDLDAFFLRFGAVEVQFNAKPQRFLLSGDVSSSFSQAGTLSNPTVFPAKPLIRVYGAGTVGIGSQTITIAAGATDHIDIDTDTCLCYEGAENRGGLVTLSGDWSEYALKGETGITLDGVTKVEITPRWWKL